MDIDNPSSQSAASGTGPGQPLNAQGPPSLTAEDQLSKLDPQTALLIKGLFDAQLQQARESAAQEIKAAFNREWDAREQTYQARLQNAEREVAGLQHRIGAQYVFLRSSPMLYLLAFSIGLSHLFPLLPLHHHHPTLSRFAFLKPLSKDGDAPSIELPDRGAASPVLSAHCNGAAFDLLALLANPLSRP